MPLSPAFRRLRSIVQKWTGRKWRASDYGDWMAPVGEIQTPENDVEGLMHELCHWLVAGDARDDEDYGLGNPFRPKDAAVAQEQMCGWIADYLYARAERKRPHSSVDVADYTEAPHTRLPALLHLRQLGRRKRTMLINALRLDGGDVGKY